MRNILRIVLGLTVITAGCQQPQKPAASSSAEQDYFPVKAYLLGQLHTIDSLQLPVTKYFSGSGKSDTSLLSTAECRQLAAGFLEQDISDPSLKSQYEESSFADQSVPSINFTYLTKATNLPLKRVDVVLKPDPVNADQVKSIYMEKYYQQGDTAIQEKLFWKADHYYQVIRSKQAGNSQPLLEQFKVVWDPTE
jgi:hypothetical protein